MATQWYYRACGRDMGPLSFFELARLVRDGSITETDVVRADWEDDWHCAVDVIGLFHTARRLDRTGSGSGSDNERHPLGDMLSGGIDNSRTTGFSTADGFSVSDLESMADLPDATAEDLESLLNAADPFEERPSWMRRLVEVASRRRRTITTQPSAGRPDTSPPSPSRLSTAIDAALSAMEIRAVRGAPGRFARWRASLDGSGLLHTVFRWGMSILIGNGVARAILDWSEVESQRLPDRQPGGLRPFPFWGSCDSFEFALLLVNCMLVAGFLGYLVARGLELMTDE